MGIAGDYTILLVWAGLGLLFFVFQLILCRLATRRAIRLMPLFIIGAWLVAALAFFAGVFGHGTGVIATHNLAALVLLITALCAAAGDGLAWLVHHLRTRR